MAEVIGQRFVPERCRMVSIQRIVRWHARNIRRQFHGRLMHKLPSQHPQYLGDYVANGLSKLGFKPCPRCNKRINWFNRAHERFEQMVNRTSKIRPGNAWHNGHQKSLGDG